MRRHLSLADHHNLAVPRGFLVLALIIASWLIAFGAWRIAGALLGTLAG